MTGSFPQSVVVKANPRRTTSKRFELTDRRPLRNGIRQPAELIPGRADYRVLISAGMLVARFAVVGQLASDGAVELVQLDLDLEAD